MGDRNGRWAMVIESDNTISFAEAEKSPGKVTVCTRTTAPHFNGS